MEIIGSFIGIAILGMVNGILAARKGYTFLSWFFAGGPIGTVALVILPQTQGIPVRIKKGDKIGLGLTIGFFVVWFIGMTSSVIMSILTTIFFGMFLAAIGS